MDYLRTPVAGLFAEAVLLAREEDAATQCVVQCGGGEGLDVAVAVVQSQVVVHGVHVHRYEPRVVCIVVAVQTQWIRRMLSLALLTTITIVIVLVAAIVVVVIELTLAFLHVYNVQWSKKTKAVCIYTRDRLIDSRVMTVKVVVVATQRGGDKGEDGLECASVLFQVKHSRDYMHELFKLSNTLTATDSHTHTVVCVSDAQPRAFAFMQPACMAFHDAKHKRRFKNFLTGCKRNQFILCVQNAPPAPLNAYLIDFS